MNTKEESDALAPVGAENEQISEDQPEPGDHIPDEVPEAVEEEAPTEVEDALEEAEGTEGVGEVEDAAGETPEEEPTETAEEDEGKVVDLAEAAKPPQLNAADLWKFRALRAETGELKNKADYLNGQIRIKELELALEKARLANQQGSVAEQHGQKAAGYNEHVDHLGKKYGIEDMSKVAIDPVTGIVQNLS